MFYKIDKILIVCMANTCRSPLAEILLQVALPNVKTSSAGINAVVGKKMNKHSQKLISSLNLNAQQHVSRQLTTEICRHSDVILVMETSHINAILIIDPTAKGKVFLIGKWLNDLEVPDPYQQGFKVYKHVFELIQKSVNSWVQKLI